MTVRDELLKIQAANNGVCSPVAVVKFARNPKTELHSHFEWDDSKAAEGYRLWQARQVISLELTVIPSEKRNVETRLFVSLSQDRTSEGGYRLITNVLEDPDLRKQLIEEALIELKRIQVKYGHLKELTAVFDAVNQVKLILEQT
jgi:hypothetical protein